MQTLIHPNGGGLPTSRAVQGMQGSDWELSTPSHTPPYASLPTHTYTHTLSPSFVHSPSSLRYSIR